MVVDNVTFRQCDSGVRWSALLTVHYKFVDDTFDVISSTNENKIVHCSNFVDKGI